MRAPTHKLALSADLTGSHLEAKLAAAHMKTSMTSKLAVRSSSTNLDEHALKMDRGTGEEILNQKSTEVRRQVAQSLEAQEMRSRQTLESEEQQFQSRKRVDVEQQLATLSNPDEAISNDADSGGAPAGRGGKISGPAGGGDPEGGELGGPASGSGRISAGAGEGDTVFDADGRDGRDAVNSPASGGGIGEGGGPVSWAILGPAGGRRLLRRVVPTCPDWITQRGLDLSVQLKFRVLDDGSVKEGILIQKTSGFPNLDQKALAALRQWIFEKYRHGPNVKSPEIWGVVKFHFVAG